MHHIANAAEHPIIHLPKVFEIDFSITKHVFMLWLVASSFSGDHVDRTRYLKQGLVPSGAGNGMEAIVVYIRDSIVQPNVGEKWVNTWAPLILTFFAFIFSANLTG